MFREKIYELKNWKEVVHTTWNPGAPGVVRIHMIPPKFHLFKIIPSIVIINGQEYVPLDEAWGILLTEFVKRINNYGEREMQDEVLTAILEDTFCSVRKIYPMVEQARLRHDLEMITGTFEDIAFGRETDTEIGQLSIGEYGKYMSSPHRMDLMVSAMTKAGKWNCNQKCVHCYATGQPLSGQKELGTEEWIRIIKLLKKARIPQLTFTGGEPTIRTDLPKLIGQARWFVTRLNTNGILLSSEYCKKLVESELDSVQITFYSSNEQVHNKLVGGNHFKQTVQGIEEAIKSGLSVSINTPLCSLNKNYVDTLRFLNEKGVYFVTCSGLIMTGNARQKESIETQLSKEELYEVLKSAVKFCHENEMEINFTSPGWLSEDMLLDLGLNPPTCGASLSNMAITPSGDVVPCQSYLGGEILGNILKTPFHNIWNSSNCKKHRAFSEKMLQKCPLMEELNE